ncbi:hypothetical protein [Virgibacillus senegalensis]|uniref:hypothetical protein n=1 Tax=Virgibacillus senegalensis TaxID=1499679 RepID=UPI000A9852A7|nr:hypothetical protein [Virgibacillus senegalensis]
MVKRLVALLTLVVGFALVQPGAALLADGKDTAPAEDEAIVLHYDPDYGEIG